MALSYTKIELAQLQQDFSRAYKAGDRKLCRVYFSQIHSIVVAIACGGVAL